MKRASYLSLILLPLSLIFAGCGAKRDLKQADEAVTGFHAQLNAGSFDQIYSDSDDLLKNAISQQKFVNLLDAVHRKLGSAESADRQGFFINYGTQGEMIRVTYATRYDGDQASEEFVFHNGRDGLRLVGYHINSDALITQ
ncbi:MAG TPA: DUF4019 domain-containing protein [Candidatus Eisenbacteria bacterium]|nr:DUF4019 domain-containing protein [Candidatus Eisenbacteria bacterium]